jgi:hypothetical protein
MPAAEPSVLAERQKYHGQCLILSKAMILQHVMNAADEFTKGDGYMLMADTQFELTDMTFDINTHIHTIANAKPNMP